LKLSAFDNLNNLSDSEVTFSIATTTSLAVTDVVNYPNPFRGRTDFTFQTNRDGAETTVKIYTVNGRLIQELDGYYTILGYNELPWDGRDRDGDALANGVYLYKIILRYGDEKVEKIEKMVVIN
jgi:flagellar hook assembly protein FlgD